MKLRYHFKMKNEVSEKIVNSRQHNYAIRIKSPDDLCIGRVAT